VPTVAMLIDFIMIIVIFYYGVKFREWKTIVPTILQAAAVVYLEIIRKTREEVYLVNIDKLSLILVLIISVMGPLIAIFALGYMEKHEAHSKWKSLSTSSSPQFFCSCLR
jgi:ech hydrogenase subunit A